MGADGPERRKRRCERRWNLYSASSWPSPGNFFFNLNLEQNPAVLHPLPTPRPSSRLARTTDGYIQNAGQTTINTFSQAGWQTR